jgi:RNA ligase (TIGR02306 family)
LGHPLAGPEGFFQAVGEGGEAERRITNMPRWLLKFLHAIGLTNLTDQQVERATTVPSVSNSTHKVEVVSIVLEKHPNADSLSVVNVFGGYTCLVRTEDWKGIAKGAYVPPDSLVDTRRPEFAFLLEHAREDGKHRVKAKKLRGIVSFGLLVPALPEWSVGDDVASILGVEHYEPSPPGEQRNQLLVGHEVAKSPGLNAPRFDVDAFRRYHNLFVEGEPVWVTEKLHGCSARYVWKDGKVHCGSREEWKLEFPNYDHVTVEWLRKRAVFKETGETNEGKVQEIMARVEHRRKNPSRNLWHVAKDATAGLEDWCKAHEGIVVYGEVFGQVQSLKYGHGSGRPVSFAAFDLLRDGKWVDPVEALELGKELPWVPLLQRDMPYSFDAVAALSDGPSLWPGANHHREGCVVKPMKERTDPHVGRVCLKCVGAVYLEKDK